MWERLRAQAARLRLSIVRRRESELTIALTALKIIESRARLSAARAGR